MSLERFCRKPMIDVRPDQTVLEAADRMRAGHVGAVVVTNAEHGQPLGILTDRDIVCRVVSPGLDPAATTVRQVMSGAPVVMRAGDSIDQALHEMREKGVRRLPIVDEAGNLTGAVSLDDLVVLLSAELLQTAGVVRENRGP